MIQTNIDCLSFGPDWSTFADRNCKKCNGKGFISHINYTPPGPYVCECTQHDEKYQPLGKSNAEIIFTTKDDKVKAIHYWYKSTDPLTISYPYTEIYEIIFHLEIGEYPVFEGRFLFNPKNKEECFKICHKLVKEQYEIKFDQSPYRKNNGQIKLNLV